MLLHIDIRDLAVVESLNLSFGPGLTVLTGETGAGKSILLTALGLALGDRADSGYVRPGAQRAEIHITFDLEDSPAAKAWIHGQELDDGGPECLVRRVIAADGRSRAFINNTPVTLQSLQEFGQELVEIHGQHAHVQLTRGNEQRRLLDASAGVADLLAKLDDSCRRWRVLNDELKQRQADSADRSARLELLEFQVDELEQYTVEVLDYQALVDEHGRQANSDRILEVGHLQLASLYEDEYQSVNARVSQAIHALTEVARMAPEFSGIVGVLQDAQVQIKEASLELRRALDRQETDVASLGMLEQRLADIHRLARKHHVKPEDLPGHYHELKSELSALMGSAESTGNIALQLEQTHQEYRRLSETLTEQRRLAATHLEERITEVIRELGMPQGQLRIDVHSDQERQPAPLGVDSVEFMVSANPGMPLRPLSRVASGGELSRVSLAVQVAATHGKRVPTMIFDEVDSGIGGAIAEVVGQKLRTLGGDRQILCVTHLPQVASQGHHHLLVEKRVSEGGTHSVVREIQGDERIPEIARMLGGVVITDQTLAHAQEMLLLGSGERVELGRTAPVAKA